MNTSNCGSNIMSSDIAEMLPGKENLRIKARVVRMWKVPAFLNPAESISLEMVLIDEKGGKIRASIRKQLIHMFEAKLEEGQVYEISSFSVVPGIAVHSIENEIKVPIIGESAKRSLEEEFLRMHPKKTLQELLGLAEIGVFVVCVEVVRIIDGQDWWYPACKCHKSVILNYGSYFCNACDKHVFHVTPRVKRVCMDSKVIDSFCSECPFSNISKDLIGSYWYLRAVLEHLLETLFMLDRLVFLQEQGSASLTRYV